MRRLVVFIKGKSADTIIDDFPVDQIPGMKKGNPWKIGKGRGYHIVILSHPDDIRI